MNLDTIIIFPSYEDYVVISMNCEGINKIFMHWDVDGLLLSGTTPHHNDPIGRPTFKIGPVI